MSDSHNEIFATVQWSNQDLKKMFVKHGIPHTKKNIDQFLKSRALKVLEERSIKEGWEILDILVSEFNLS